MSPAEHRALAVFLRVAELDNCLRTLRIAIAAIQAESTSMSPNVEQYRYQVENYLLRLTGIYDRACRFAGVAIGMPSAQVDRHAANADVLKCLKSSGVQGAVERLRELKALLKPYWDNRNMVAHSGEFSSRELVLFVTVTRLNLETVSLEDLNKLMVSHFRDGAIDFNLLALQAEDLLYRLIEVMAPNITAPLEGR